MVSSLNDLDLAAISSDVIKAEFLRYDKNNKVEHYHKDQWPNQEQEVFIPTANFSAPAMEQLAAISSFFEVFQWQKQVNYLQYDPIQYIPEKIIR